MVECGGLENRFTYNLGNEGSNPSSSARNHEGCTLQPFFVGTHAARNDAGMLLQSQSVKLVTYDFKKNKNRRQSNAKPL